MAIRASGQVQVQVTIDEAGRVTSAAAVSGHPLLARRRSMGPNQQVHPTTLSGQPVKVTGVIIYNFVPR
ncbi:MAG: energy transducer TonB [Acidobacteria bacterium]|nr:energy transducer TonB [Acidobacteriota bacterium]